MFSHNLIHKIFDNQYGSCSGSKIHLNKLVSSIGCLHSIGYIVLLAKNTKSLTLYLLAKFITLLSIWIFSYNISYVYCAFMETPHTFAAHNITISGLSFLKKSSTFF
jgi:hypothetical protein